MSIKTFTTIAILIVVAFLVSLLVQSQIYPIIDHDELPSDQVSESAETYESLCEKTRSEIEFWATRAAESPQVWSSQERLAAAYLQKAKLTGKFEDYAAAESALIAAFAQADPGAGPYLLRAQLNFTLHRLDRIEADLHVEEQRVLLDSRTRAAIVGLRADVAFHQGRYTDALGGYEAALGLHHSVDALCRIAHYRWKTGEFETAEAFYDQAESLVHGKAPVLRAWFDLQRGLLDLDRENLDQAMVHYRDADQHVGRWWLIEEHMAEVYALTGENQRARSLYEDLVLRTGDPEFMSALANLTEGEEKKQWLWEADRAYQDRLSMFPEAALGHALGYALDHVSDNKRVIEWATQNFELRPGGEAGVLLAQAYHRTGRISKAREAIEAVLATPYSTPDLRETANRILMSANRRAFVD